MKPNDIKYNFGKHYVKQPLTRGIDISASDDSFGEDDYAPSCVEGVDVVDITKTLDLDEGENVQVKFPTASAGTFEGTEALLKDAKYESAVDPNANAILKRIRDELNVQVFSVECEGSALFGIGVGAYRDWETDRKSVV